MATARSPAAAWRRPRCCSGGHAPGRLRWGAGQSPDKGRFDHLGGGDRRRLRQAPAWRDVGDRTEPRPPRLPTAGARGRARPTARPHPPVYPARPGPRRRRSRRTRPCRRRADRPRRRRRRGGPPRRRPGRRPVTGAPARSRRRARPRPTPPPSRRCRSGSSAAATVSWSCGHGPAGEGEDPELRRADTLRRSSAVQTISVTRSPSVLTSADQPGTGSTRAEVRATSSGMATVTPTVDAVSLSVGTSSLTTP